MSEPHLALATAGIVMGLVLVTLFSSLKVVPEGRCLAIIRLGRLSHLLGPGLAVLVPVIDRGVPIVVGQEGVLAEGGGAELGGHFIPVEAPFSLARPGVRVKVERIESRGATVAVVVGRAS